ncbi:hypothetical protein [Bradyrhizobium sp.]|nr:hypothetical protein [Bradyrhizobium sp.]
MSDTGNDVVPIESAERTGDDAADASEADDADRRAVGTSDRIAR